MSELYKYARTYHVPWSPGLQNDDRKHPDMSVFNDKKVIVSIKQDGENCLDENTLIITEDGEKTIREICEIKYNGKILTYSIETGEQEWQTPYEWFIYDITEFDDWYLIILEDNTQLIITGEQYVYLPQLLCYRQVKDLKENDDFLLRK